MCTEYGMVTAADLQADLVIGVYTAAQGRYCNSSNDCSKYDTRHWCKRD